VTGISRISMAALLAFALAACGGDSGNGDGGGGGGGGGGDDGGSGGSGSGTPSATYAVGGTVTGLTGTGLVIRNNGTESLTIDASGAFAFSTELADGEVYAVEVTTQPANPDNFCTVDNGEGIIDGADVGDVEILCTGPLSLVSTAPADGDPAVSRAVEPILTFSADIDAATAAAAGSIRLESDAGEVDLGIDVTGAAVTLSPASPLLPLTDYRLTVTTAVEGAGGERMAEPVTAEFRTRDGAWSADLDIGPGTADTAEAQIAFDHEGNALAVWSQATLDSTDLWWNYYAVGAGWGTPAPLELNDDDLYAGGVQFGFDGQGHALAVWIVSDSVANATSVRASRFAPGTGWETPQYIENDPGTVIGYLDMAINANGDAVAAWSQFDGTTMNLWSARIEGGGSWSAPEIADESDGVTGSPSVAIDEDGDFAVLWPMRDQGSFNWKIWARNFRTSGGWGSSTMLSGINNLASESPRIAMDREGNALAVWFQGLGLESGVFASRYEEGAGWLQQEQISVGAQLEDLEIAFGRDGNAIAVWGQWVDENGQQGLAVHASRYVAGTGWEAVQSISSAQQLYPKIAVDASGNALAAWFEVDLTLPNSEAFSVWGNRYVNGGGWTAPERIGSYGSLIGTAMPNLAIDPNGDAFVIWTRGSEVRVNRFE